MSVHADPVGYTVADPASVPPSRPVIETGPGGPTRSFDATPSPTAPAANPPRWSGKKTAIAAALAIGVASGGSYAAAAAIPAGSSSVGTGGGQTGRQFPGGSRGGQAQFGQQNGPGQGQPGSLNQPGGAAGN